MGWCVALLIVGCQNEEVGLQFERESGRYNGEILVINEGNFNAGNASLTSYEPFTEETSQRVFENSNGVGLGDVAQDAVWVGSECWIAINGSGRIYRVDDNLLIQKQWDNVGTPAQILRFGDHILFRDLFQPQIRAIDVNDDQIEVITTPSRVVDMEVFQDELWLVLNSGDVLRTSSLDSFEPVNELPSVSRAVVNAEGLFFVDDQNIMYSRFGQLVVALPGPPTQWVGFENQILFTAGDTLYTFSFGTGETSVLSELDFSPYGLSVDPVDGDIYVFNPKGFNSLGECLRLSNSGFEIDRFTCGIIPVKAVFRP